jgi:serine/threonine protein kinase
MIKYNIIKELGHGTYGTTYEVEYNNERFALKKQKVLEKDINNKESNIWKELKFYKWIEKLDKNDKKFFMRLHKWNFDNSCTLNQQRTIHNDYLKELDKSKHCMNLLLDLKEGNLNQLNLNLNLNYDEKKSLLIQILYIIYLLRKDKWIHGDIHPANICYTKIDYEKNIKICINNKSYQFKSYGYQFSLIDYGTCVNRKNLKKQKELKDFDKLFKMNFDLWCFIEDFALNNYQNGILIRQQKINLNKFHKDLLYNVYKNQKILYEKIKHVMSNEIKLFEQFEKNQYKKELSYNFSQFVQIYDVKLYYNTLNLNLIYNQYSTELLEFIKINQLDMKKILKTLLSV